MDCVICHAQALLPVQLIGFPCATPSCLSLTVCCLRCAESFLELDKPVHQRSATKKCLYCDATRNPRSVVYTKATSYRKNLMLMKLDTTIHDCPNTCDFRGLQLEINRHLDTCPRRMARCECGGYMRFHEVAEHINTNCKVFQRCRWCPPTTHVFRKTEIIEHWKAHHGAHQCPLCHLWTRLNFARHLQDCTHKGPCIVCHAEVEAKNCAPHYKTHLEYFVPFQQYLSEKFVAAPRTSRSLIDWLYKELGRAREVVRECTRLAVDDFAQG